MIIVLARLLDGVAIEYDFTLTEQSLEEIIFHGRVVCKVHIFLRTQDQFTSDVEFDIEIYLCIVGRYKNFQILLIHGGDGFVRGLYRPEYRRLVGCVRKDAKLSTYGRELGGTHNVTEEG